MEGGREGGREGEREMEGEVFYMTVNTEYDPMVVLFPTSMPLATLLFAKDTIKNGALELSIVKEPGMHVASERKSYGNANFCNYLPFFCGPGIL